MGEATAVKRGEEPSALRILEPKALFERMNEVFDAISRRAFEIFEGRGRMPGRDLEDWFQAEADMLHPTHVNITESDDALQVGAEVPGFNEKQLEISVEPRRLTIAGKKESEKEQKKGKTVYAEKCSSEIFRVVDLPVDVEADKVTATLKNGVLEMTMPKAAKAGTSRIQPKVS
jgi:HSP20 family protein